MRPKWLALIAFGSLFGLSNPTLACGPDFPPEYLTFRPGTLAEMPDGIFTDEVMTLVPRPVRRFTLNEEDPAEARRGGEKETALYQQGAKSFHDGDHALARKKFLALLDLPKEERRRLSTLAAFMLGRLAENPRQAKRYFAHVRELIEDGFADPLALGVESLGEEARIRLRQDDDLGAIHLYAVQAAHNHGGAALSLLFVARRLVASEKRLGRALADPVAQKLLATYAWTRSNEGFFTDKSTEARLAQTLLQTLGELPKLNGADRFAAAAWRQGRFDLAEKFASKEDSPLAFWVRGKLALRQGDRAATESWLAKARGTDTREWPFSFRIAADQTVLALARGDVPGAWKFMVSTCSWSDIAYLAERVLTVDELRAVVSNPHALAGCVLPKWETGLRFDHRLKELLARRLMRLERFDEALTYFQNTENAEKARAYAQARKQVLAARKPIDKARALYQSARLARRDGLEILGTEMAPDYAAFGGNYNLAEDSRGRMAYQFGFQFDFDGDYDAYLARRKTTEEEFLVGQSRIVGLSTEQDLFTDIERGRAKETAPPHNTRFHYRQTAADLAEQAANLLPPRSQAYAMVLCHAARFVASTDLPRMQRLYRTYVKNGAIVAGAYAFGQECAEPDFDRAAKSRRACWIESFPRIRKRYWLGSASVLALAGFLLILRRSRHRKA